MFGEINFKLPRVIDFNSQRVRGVVPSANSAPLSTQIINSSVAAISETTKIDSSYSKYIWVISNLITDTNSVDAYITVKQGGSFIGGSNYFLNGIKATGSLAASSNLGTAQFATGNAGFSSGNACSLLFEFLNPSVADDLNVMLESMQYNGGSNPLYNRAGGFVVTTASTTGIKLAMSAGNIVQARATLYGEK